MAGAARSIAVITTNLSELTDAQKRAFNAASVLSGAFGAFGAQMDAIPFAEVEEGIIAVTARSYILDIEIQALKKRIAEASASGDTDLVAQLEATTRGLEAEKVAADANIPVAYSLLGVWRQVRGELDFATATLKKYQDQLDASEKKTDLLTRQQEKLNESLQKHRDRLAELQSMKLTGETAASDQSFAMEQQINALSLAIMKAQDEGRYNDAASLAAQKKKLERQKEEFELQQKVPGGLEDQRRQIENITDESRKHEMSLADIIKAIRSTQKEIDKEEKQHAKLEKAIRKERDMQWELKLEIDNTSKVVDDLKSHVDAMAQNFTTRLGEIKTAAQEAADAVANVGAAASGAGANFLAPATGPSGGSTYNNSTASNTYIYNIDNLSLPAVTDGAGFDRSLRDYALRRQVT